MPHNRLPFDRDEDFGVAESGLTTAWAATITAIDQAHKDGLLDHEQHTKLHAYVYHFIDLPLILKIVGFDQSAIDTIIGVLR